MNINSVALVVIGRNEAQHLKISLPAVKDIFKRVIYVDSGSTDDSREIARQNNAEVIELDTTFPFTAARARNAGFKALRCGPKIQYVQFIDGDCELIPKYLTEAICWLEAHLDFGMVCGRRRERHPDRSVFNMLCNLEWDTPVGDTKYCGGDVTVRYEALEQIGGYNSELIAGEDPEVCIRLRKAGWRIYRIDEDMTWHDANITRLSQWWKRHQRTGHAYAEGAYMHGKPPELHWVRETRRNWLWGGILCFSLIGGILISPWIWLLLLLFPMQAIRIAFNAPPQVNQHSFLTRLLYGLDCSLAKVPELTGQLRFVFSRINRKKQTLIEYK